MACSRAKFTLNYNKQVTITQMNEEGIRKIILLARPEGKRGTGRPKTRWVDSAEQEGEKTGKVIGGDGRETGINGKSVWGSPTPSQGCRADDDNCDDYDYGEK
jgi:hypothetical protein